MKPALSALVALLSVSSLAGCQATGHPVVAATTTAGVVATGADLEAVIDRVGPVTVEAVVAADWVVDRSGLIDLDHPKAKAAGLVDGDEPIELIFHAVRHPTRGLFLVDSGLERAFRDAPSKALIHGLGGKLAHLEKMKTRTLTGDWVAAQKEPVRGVFLTHLHVDHVLGLRDLPASAFVMVGPGDAKARSFENLFMAGVYDDALEGKRPLAFPPSSHAGPAEIGPRNGQPRYGRPALLPRAVPCAGRAGRGPPGEGQRRRGRHHAFTRNED